MNKIIASVILVGLSIILQGQDMFGVIGGNYAGIYGISINPSSMGNSRLYLDFNLVGVQGYLENNYAYLQRDDVLNLITSNVEPEYYTSENELRTFNIFRNGETKFGYQSIKILGPAAMMNKGKHSFAVATAMRSVTSFKDVPPDIAVFLYEAIDYDFQHNINYSHDTKIKTGSLTWFETSFSYAYNFHRFKWNSWTAGITIKPLIGVAGVYGTISDLDYFVHNDDSASVYNADFEYGVSLPINYSTNQYIPGFKPRGFGIGIDLGITFQRTSKGHTIAVFNRICEQPFDDYNYRLGFSILDIGFVRFKKDAIYEEYNDASTEWYKPYDTLPYSSVYSIVNKINRFFNPAEANKISEEAFTINLPPALSFQGDVKIGNRLYANLIAIYGLKIGRNFLYRPSVVAITPRFESPRWEVSLPVSFYEFDILSPKIGFMVRYGNIFIGFDRINTYLGLNEFTGMDFYGGIRLNLSNLFRMNFIKGECGLKQFRNIEIFDYRNF